METAKPKIKSSKVEHQRLTGEVAWRLYDEHGGLKDEGRTKNLVTQEGDRFYGERAALAAGQPNAVTGMRLGQGTTAAAKTGAGAAIVTYVSGSQKALDGTYPQSSLNGSSRRITYQASWAAGVATADGISEVVLTNETPLTNVAGAAGNTIARALLSPVINKAAGDTLVITWHHDLLGA